MNEVLARQLALDFCCTEAEVRDKENHYTEHRFLDGRRRFREGNECVLKIAAVGGKLLFSGSREMMEWCKKEYDNTAAAWFFEAKILCELNDRLLQNGHQIKMVHPFFISETKSEAVTEGYEIRWYEGDAIEQFRGDKRFEEAYSFYADAPDVIGVSAVKDGQIVGMAGASADSPTMWQIGINVEPGQEGRGVGTMLVTLLKNEILERGRLPYYGTAFSHIASQRVALGSGFALSWVELVTERRTAE